MFNYKAFDVNSIGYSHSHGEKKKPMQDSSLSVNQDDYVIAVISDGHGSAPYLRSDRGSSIAVKVVTEMLENVYAKYNTIHDLDDVEIEKVKKGIIESLKTRWRGAVEDDYTKDPFSDEEFLSFKEDILSNPSKEVQDRWKRYYTRYKNGTSIFKAYGCTLICVLICDDYCLGVHVGDGKCVAIYDDGECYKPIPWDEACIANICTSMCDDDFSCRVHIFEKKPMAVFLASDGIDDTFGDGGGLYNFYRKICYNIIKSGDEYIYELERSLPMISEKGSKDDISIAGCYNYNQLISSEEFIVAQIELENQRSKLTKLNSDLNNANYRLRGCNNALKEAEKELLEIREEKENIANKMVSVAKAIKKSFFNIGTEELDENINEYNRKISILDTKINKLQHEFDNAQSEKNRLIIERDESLNAKKGFQYLDNANEQQEVLISDCDIAEKKVEDCADALDETEKNVNQIKQDIQSMESDIKSREERIIEMKVDLNKK